MKHIFYNTLQSIKYQIFKTEIALQTIPTTPPSLMAISAQPSVPHSVPTNSTIHPGPFGPSGPLSLASITCKQHELLFPGSTHLHL